MWRDLHYAQTIDFMEFIFCADSGALHIENSHQLFVSLTVATSASQLRGIICKFKPIWWQAIMLSVTMKHCC